MMECKADKTDTVNVAGCHGLPYLTYLFFSLFFPPVVRERCWLESTSTESEQNSVPTPFTRPTRTGEEKIRKGVISYFVIFDEV
jgi:hypothetical protein